MLDEISRLSAEVARNPDFYLFGNIAGDNRYHVQPLERRDEPRPQMTELERRGRYVEEGINVFIFLAILGVLLWLIRMFLENRRWSRAFQQQNELHARLIDRFASNQEVPPRVKDALQKAAEKRRVVYDLQRQMTNVEQERSRAQQIIAGWQKRLDTRVCPRVELIVILGYARSVGHG